MLTGIYATGRRTVDVVSVIVTYSNQLFYLYFFAGVKDPTKAMQVKKKKPLKDRIAEKEAKMQEDARKKVRYQH